MSQENFWILFSKKIANEATPEELAELEKLIQQHPEWQYAIQNLQDIWNTNPRVDTITEEDAYLMHLQRMKEKNIPFTAEEQEKSADHTHHRRKTTTRIIGYSVAIAASLVIAFLLFIKPKTEVKPTIAVKEVSEISTRLGSKSRIQLPDGSVVWINAGSKLTYNKDFGKTTREVSLSGEAFFDVVKDKTRPFLIHTNAIDIKVLGTAFNVKAYPEDKTTEASLIRGTIEVAIRSRPNDKVILSPNEKIVVENKPVTDSTMPANDNEENLVVINKLKRDREDSSVIETKWIENKLVFDDEPFKNIVVKMERWFNVEIEISDPKLAERHLTGKFESESIEQALESLAYTSNNSFVFERKGNKIFIHR